MRPRLFERHMAGPPSTDAGAGYVFKAVEPDLPDLDDYLPLLREMHASGYFSNWGPLATRLESGLLDCFGRDGERCVSMANATAALSAAVLASGRTGPVILPAFTFPASLGAVLAAAAKPIVIDVDPETWAMGAAALEQALDETGAGIVILVKPFGIAVDLSEQLAICADRNVTVIIDNASGLGIERGTYPGGLDLFEVFSLHATKPFAVGEGGAAFAPARFEERLRGASGFALRTYDRPEGPAWGFNGKMSELHAAVGVAQLERFAGRVAGRQQFVHHYVEMIARHEELRAPANSKASTWQVFPLLMPSEAALERFVAASAAEGVEIRRYYRPSLADWPNVQRLGPCPVSGDLANRMCVLPVRADPDAPQSIELRRRVAVALEHALSDRARQPS